MLEIRDYLLKYSYSLDVPNAKLVSQQLQKQSTNFDLMDSRVQTKTWEEFFCGNSISQLIPLKNSTNCALYQMGGEPKRYYQIYYAVKILNHAVNAIKSYRSDGLILCIDDIDMTYSYFKGGFAVADGYSQTYKNIIEAVCEICRTIENNQFRRSPANDLKLRKQLGDSIHFWKSKYSG